MSYRPHYHSLKEELNSNLQKIFGVRSSHSDEGNCLSKNLVKPQPNSDQISNSERKLNPNSILGNLCGAKRDRASTLGGIEDTMFKPFSAQSKLFSYTNEDGLQAKLGLNESSSRPNNLGEVPLNSLAGYLSSMKSRDRAVSSASDTTNISSSKSKSKCSRCGQPSDNLVGNPSDNVYLSPHPTTGKLLVSFAYLCNQNLLYQKRFQLGGTNSYYRMSPFYNVQVFSVF